MKDKTYLCVGKDSQIGQYKNSKLEIKIIKHKEQIIEVGSWLKKDRYAKKRKLK